MIMGDKYDKLKEQLELQEWPGVFMFKFIVPNQSDLIARTTALFDNAVDLAFNQSKTGKYVSVTAKEMMLDVDTIIAKYKEAEKIEGLISL